MESQAPREPVATVVLRVFAASPGLPGRKGSRERRALKAALDLEASKELLGPREMSAHAAPSGLVAVVLPAPRALKESKDPRVSVAKLVLVLAALLGLWDPRVNVVRRASRAPKETWASLVPRVLPAATVSRATRVLLVPWAAPGSADRRETAALRAPKETPGSKAPKETRATSAFVDLQALPVWLVRPAHREPLVSRGLSDPLAVAV